MRFGSASGTSPQGNLSTSSLCPAPHFLSNPQAHSPQHHHPPQLLAHLQLRADLTTFPHRATFPTDIPSERRDIEATHLEISTLNIDLPVQLVPVGHYSGQVGCPPHYVDGPSLAAPDYGIATPNQPIEGVENKVWIFGHSRWQGVETDFHRLEDLNLGDQVIIDGTDRQTGQQYSNLVFTMTHLYLADQDAGSDLIKAPSEEAVPIRPEVVINTSARENGVGKAWILDQSKVLSKAENLVQGDLADPCRYLELWIVAEASWNPDSIPVP